mgnify:CR=1 FL=1
MRKTHIVGVRSGMWVKTDHCSSTVDGPSDHFWVSVPMVNAVIKADILKILQKKLDIMKRSTGLKPEAPTVSVSLFEQLLRPALGVARLLREELNF